VIRLLVAEDHGPLREHLVRYFADFGIQCAQAGNVPEALRCVEERAVDAVMIDLLLDGRFAVPVINRAVKCGVPVLIHTAFDRDSVSRQVGPVARQCTIVEKPHELSALRSRIVAVVSERKAANV